MDASQKRRKCAIKNSAVDNKFRILTVDASKKLACVMCETLYNSVCVEDIKTVLICATCKSKMVEPLSVSVTEDNATTIFMLEKMCTLDWFIKCSSKTAEFFEKKQAVIDETNERVTRDAILYDGMHIVLHPEGVELPAFAPKLAGHPLFSTQTNWDNDKIYLMLTDFIVDCFNTPDVRDNVVFGCDDVRVLSDKIVVSTITGVPHKRAAVLFIRLLLKDSRVKLKHKRELGKIWDDMTTYCTEEKILKDMF